MQLELKTKEYKMLCDKLEKLKEQGIDLNSKDLIELRRDFIKNNQEIENIKNQLKELQDNE